MGGPAGREAANGGRMAQMAAAPAGQGSPLANLGGDGLEMGRAGGGQGGEDGNDDDNDEQKSGLGPASTTTQRSLRRGRVASDVLTHYSMEPLNELIRRNSINCCLLFMPLPTDSKERLAGDSYMKHVDVLTADLPPTMMVAAGEDSAVVSMDI